MKIKEITEEHILFDSDSKITFNHDQDCCESNYADLDQLEDLAKDRDFVEPLSFEFIKESGFRFGNEGNMFFIPCYSSQNGFYSTGIDIYYNGICVCSGCCEEDFN